MRIVGVVALIALVGCKGGKIDEEPEDTDTGGNQAQVGDITVTPTSIDLGLLFVGASATADITIGNVGNGEVDVRLEVIGGKADVYTLSSYTASPAPDAESVHTLTLTPTTWGDHAVSVLVDDQLDEEGAVEVTVKASVQMDADGDGFGSAESGGEDCDDTNAQVNPSIAETWYDGVDSDCAGDDDFDQDHDGVRADTDCDDADATVFPGATDAWYDGIDSDCAGNSDFDQDLDGYDSSDHGGADCDDTSEVINPDATETWYDGIDSDCDGANDYDQDGDGSNLGADCDDTNGAAYPGATEVWYDDVDQACDGGDDWDQDGDGTPYPTDCNDTDPTTTGPTAEVMDGNDNDCDGVIDDFTVTDLASGVLFGAASQAIGSEGMLSAGGDVTSNGVADVYVGSSYGGTSTGSWGGSYTGAVWVVDGGSAAAAYGTITSYDAAEATGSTTYYTLRSVWGPMGDIDDDGVDDLVATVASTTGYAFAWNGATSGSLSVSTYLARYGGDSSGDQLDKAVVSDIDGDGIADVITAATSDNDSAGGEYYTGNIAFFAGTSSLSSSSYTISSGSDAEIHGSASQDYLGRQLLAEDVNGDGYGDVLAGAYGADGGGSGAGAVYLILGNNSFSFDDYAEDAADAVFNGTTSGHQIGSDQMAVGDLDGNGEMDLAIGEEEADNAVWVFLGVGAWSGDYDMDDADHEITGTSVGSSVALSDLDSDGDDDLVAGADVADAGGTDRGALYLFSYDAGWARDVTTADASATFSGVADYDYLGNVLAGGYDFDGDGTEDVVAGAPGVDTGATNGGAVYIIPGW
jgi:hypothetical protein